MKKASPALVMLLVLAAPLAGRSQQPRQLQPNELPTNLPGTTTLVAPPEGFDAIHASDEELAYHGFPPRPNETTNAKAFATWKRAITASKTRIVPTLEQTNVFHGPAKVNKSVTPPSDVSNMLYSYNWSGYLNPGGATSYGASSFYYLYSDFVVPIAQQAFGVCNGGWDYASSWVGIDGWGTADVLQSGVEFDAYCNGGATAAFYSPWFEWYPAGEIRITNLPTAPGDEYFVEVWNTSPTQGYAYLVNYDTNKAVQIGFTAPSGTHLVGNSAEWIVESPYVGGAFTILTNYTDVPFWSSIAVTFNSTVAEPSSASSYPLTMLDGHSLPISFPTLLGPSAFLMQDTGSAK